MNISLVNMHRLMVRSANRQDGHNDQVVLHVGDLLPGVYLLSIRFDGMHFSESILIK